MGRMLSLNLHPRLRLPSSGGRFGIMLAESFCRENGLQPAPPYFLCRRLTMTQTTRGFEVELSLYDASFTGHEEPLQIGRYQAFGRPCDTNKVRGMLLSAASPWIFVSERGEYQVVAKVKAPKDARPVEFWSALSALGLCKDDPASAHAALQRSARLRLQGIAGRLRLNLQSAGRPLASLPLLVRPDKLDYPTDLENLLRELSRVATSLSLRARSEAKLSVSPSQAAPSPLERLLVLQALLRPPWLPRAFRVISKTPHHEIQARPAILGRRDFAKARQEELLLALCARGQRDPERLRLVQRSLTFDTPENRFVQRLWKRIQREAKHLQREFRAAPEISSHTEDIARRAASLPPPIEVQEVSDLPVKQKASLWLRRRPGYREAWLARRLMGRELSPSFFLEEALEAPGRTLPLLYEAWCLLVLARCLEKIQKGTAIKIGRASLLNPQKKTKTPYPMLLRPEGVLRFQTNRKSALSPDISLGYQVQFSSSRASSLELRPDFYVELFGKKLVLDAKYRLAEDSNAPQHEDLLIAHAYKDALRVDGSFVLYPGTGAPTIYRQASPLLLPAVGAFPLRPSGGEVAHGEEALGEFLQSCAHAESSAPARRAAEARAPYGVGEEEG